MSRRACLAESVAERAAELRWLTEPESCFLQRGEAARLDTVAGGLPKLDVEPIERLERQANIRAISVEIDGQKLFGATNALQNRVAVRKHDCRRLRGVVACPDEHAKGLAKLRRPRREGAQGGVSELLKAVIIV